MGGLTDSHLKSLSKSLGETKVTVVKLSGNAKLTGTGLGAFGDLFANNKSELRELHCARCAIDDVSALAPLMGSDSKLALLDLSQNAIQDSALQTLAKQLPSCKSLFHVQLAQNKLSASGAALLADAVKASPHIRTVNVSGNEVGDDGAKALASAALANENLSAINLSECGVSAAGVAAVMDAFMNASGLNKVVIDGNAIKSGDALAALGKDGATLSRLSFARAQAQ